MTTHRTPAMYGDNQICQYVQRNVSDRDRHHYNRGDIVRRIV